MPRAARPDFAGLIFHVLNRANGKRKIFKKERDFQAFEDTLFLAIHKFDIQLYSYCIMPNHWHLVLSPNSNGGMGKCMQWLTLTHTQRYNAFHERIGYGQVYQGRYKSFLVEKDSYFLQLCRYVERNPLRAQLVTQAEQWQWSSLHKRKFGTNTDKQHLAVWPKEIPNNQIEWINKEQKSDTKVTESIRTSIHHGKPFGSDKWTKITVKNFNLEHSIRPRGRPKSSLTKGTL